MNEIVKYCNKNPGIKKTFIAEQIGVTKQCLNYWLTAGKERPLTAELKAKVRTLK